MKQFGLIVLSVIVLFFLKKKEVYKQRVFSKVHIEHIFEDPNMSIRAITISNDDDLFISGNNSSIGFSDYSCWMDEISLSLINYDSLLKPELEFRAISQTTDFLLSS